ncbi:hypothetical protein AGMMS4952_14240 [Spirochaetia bacterium]|nr:hypothetical protein AGMMS4952_14240 [Spirochaetia bacterium]
MTYHPSREEAASLAGDYKTIPVSLSLSMGEHTPVETFRILKNLSRQCFILESLEDPNRHGRYTFLDYDPKLEISCTNGVLSIKNGTTIKKTVTNPGVNINQIIEENRSPLFPYQLFRSAVKLRFTSIKLCSCCCTI